MSSKSPIEKKQEMLLTSRWWHLPQVAYTNATIHNYLYSDAHQVIVTAGRRSLKTEIAKRKAVLYAMENETCQCLIIAPTLAQVKNIYWTSTNGMKGFFPSYMVKRIYESELRIDLINGSSIKCGSADTIQRYEGTDYNFVIVDEAGDTAALNDVLQRSIGPMLINTQGYLYVIGVPRQSMGMEYKEMWNACRERGSGWETYSWKASLVLPEKDLKKIKSQIDPLTFRQEYEGEFHDGIGGKAYYMFNEDKHIGEMGLNLDNPLFACIDFNTKIMPINVGQITKDYIYIADQSVTRQTNVHTAIPALKQKLIEIHNGDEIAAKNKLTYLYGDYTGTNTSVSTRGSAWDIVKELFRVDGWNVQTRIKMNPALDKRIASVNNRLETADGLQHITLNPKCEELIKDLRYVSYADLDRNRNKLQAELQERTHSSDALGYLVHYHFPLRTTGAGIIM